MAIRKQPTLLSSTPLTTLHSATTLFQACHPQALIRLTLSSGKHCYPEPGTHCFSQLCRPGGASSWWHDGRLHLLGPHPTPGTAGSHPTPGTAGSHPPRQALPAHTPHTRHCLLPHPHSHCHLPAVQCCRCRSRLQTGAARRCPPAQSLCSQATHTGAVQPAPLARNRCFALGHLHLGSWVSNVLCVCCVQRSWGALVEMAFCRG